MKYILPKTIEEIDILSLPYCFIREFQDKIKWEWISSYQKLSEDFIREFLDKVDWIGISCKQKLSEYFIREFSDRINWDYIFYKSNLSEEYKSRLLKIKEKIK